jgi:hypothetical protein
MRRETAVQVGRSRLRMFALTLLIAVAACVGAAGAASASDGSFEKKVQKFTDLCVSQGGAVVPDGPNGLICQLGSPVITFEALNDAARLCRGQLHGEFAVNTAESFYACTVRPVFL